MAAPRPASPPARHARAAASGLLARGDAACAQGDTASAPLDADAIPAPPMPRLSDVADETLTHSAAQPVPCRRLASSSSSPSRIVVWIRHGQSTANTAPADDASVRDAVLSDLGRRQAGYWSEDARVAPLLNAVDVCVSSPLRRAFQTASRVFRRSTNPGFSIVAQRLAREKWWHLHQCRGLPHARLVQFLADEGIHDVRGLDDLARVDEYWNPPEEEAIMREGRPNEFRRLSASALQRLREDVRCGYGDAGVVAVSCHWGVVRDLLGVEKVGNAELLVTKMDVATGEMRVVERHRVPERLRSP